MRDQNAKPVSVEYTQKLEAALFEMHHRATAAEEECRAAAPCDPHRTGMPLSARTGGRLEAILGEAAEG